MSWVPTIWKAPPRRGRLAATAAGAAFACLLGLLLFPPHAQALDQCFRHEDGALCNDNNPCTLNDVCDAGSCKGIVAPNGSDCTDGNLCTRLDRCLLGLCVGQTVPEGDPCDDGNMCTVGELCRGGVCRPQGNLQCNQGGGCTSGLCIPSEGCVYAPILMCTNGDGGMGGMGGGGGMGGNGGMGGGAGSGGPDAGDDAGPAWDAVGDSREIADTLAADASPRSDAGDAGADSSMDPAQVVYIVEGGAWLCAYQSGRYGSADPLTIVVGLMWAIGLWGHRRRRKRARRNDR